MALHSGPQYSLHHVLFVLFAACDCNGYSETCYYDNARRVSVCDNCTNSTTGDRCEACLPGFAMVTGIVATETNTAASPVAEVTSLICEGEAIRTLYNGDVCTSTGVLSEIRPEVQN